MEVEKGGKEFVACHQEETAKGGGRWRRGHVAEWSPSKEAFGTKRLIFIL